MTESRPLLICSFCGKSQKMVEKLIAGPGVHICNECIDLCNKIIEEELAGAEDKSVPDKTLVRAPAGSNRFVRWKLEVRPIARDDDVTPRETCPSIGFLARREDRGPPEWMRFSLTWEEMDRFSGGLAALLARIDRSSGGLSG
jgi:hypothetical protein